MAEYSCTIQLTGTFLVYVYMSSCSADLFYHVHISHALSQYSLYTSPSPSSGSFSCHGDNHIL